MSDLLTEHLFRKYGTRVATDQPNQNQDKPEEPVQTLPARVQEETQYLTPLTTIKTEGNFARFPFFALSRQDAARKTKTEYRITEARAEQRVEILWRVTSNSEFGYPGPFDRKVHKAIEYLITAQGWPVQNPIPFSTYQVCKLIGVTNAGPNKGKVTEAIKRVITTAVESQGAFFDKEKKRYISDTFHLYERLVLKGEEDRKTGKIAEHNLLYLGSWYLDSLNAHHVRPIDFQYLKSLQSDVAGRLYELLGLKFFGLFRHNRPYYRKSKSCRRNPTRAIGLVFDDFVTDKIKQLTVKLPAFGKIADAYFDMA